MRLRSCSLWAGLAGLFVWHASANADNLAVYDGALGGVPQDSRCWIYDVSGSFPAPSNSGGAVTLGPTSNSGTASWHQELVPFTLADGAAVTGVVRVVSSSYYQGNPYKRSGYYLTLADKNGKWASLGISSDRVLLQTAGDNWSDQTFLFNSTTAFNTYRLEFSGTTAKVLINGNVVLTDTVGSGAGLTSRVTFGDTSILANCNTLTASIQVEGVPDCSSGDLNCDGIVDGADLGILLGAWNSDACAADLNHDLIVDGADLGILLGNWGS